MRNVKGFSLIELMIVVAIIGIIAAYATTSYQKSVMKSRRSDAKITLMDIAAQFERCFTMNGQYNTTDAVAGPPPVPARICPVVSNMDVLAISNNSQKGFYTIAVDSVDTTSFSITATPVNSDDTECTTFTLTNTGVKTAGGTIGTLDANGNRCW